MQRAVARASSATAARSAAPAASCAMAHAGAGATGQHAAHAAALQCRPYACMRGSLQTVRCSHAGFARSREHAWANGHALGHDSHANGATATIINGHAAMEILPTTAASLPQTFQTYDDEDVATHAPRRMHSPAASTSKPALKYETIMLKVSGEALQGSLGFGVDATVMRAVAEEVQRLVHHGVRVAIVVGGGNYFRGANAWQGLERATADYVGMLATVMNALQLQGALEGLGVDTRVQTAIEMREVAEPYIRRRAVAHLNAGRVVIFGAGTGNPFFTTDTAAALRAAEINAQVFIKATKVDGIYDSDPVKNPMAKKYNRLSYRQCTDDSLRVMDETAITLCKENNIPVLVLNMLEEGNILRAVLGEDVGTVVCEGCDAE